MKSIVPLTSLFEMTYFRSSVTSVCRSDHHSIQSKQSETLIYKKCSCLGGITPHRMYECTCKLHSVLHTKVTCIFNNSTYLFVPEQTITETANILYFLKQLKDLDEIGY